MNPARKEMTVGWWLGCVAAVGLAAWAAIFFLLHFLLTGAR